MIEKLTNLQAALIAFAVVILTILLVMATTPAETPSEFFISGSVSSTTDGLPISNATVQAFNNETGLLLAQTLTDPEGYYNITITNATAGTTYRIRAEKDGIAREIIVAQGAGDTAEGVLSLDSGSAGKLTFVNNFGV